ncbi:hypothetical protein Egran_02294 [Elaphomyces granulatus]|uniref:DUF726 domain-containing protein n=1 Tax=Elaphomyces granulatus TaxID=519963 RepID=A0A232M0R1_9EURO|nr:hypothetical protein Egran_02294 [Elaphomyces granulatus]
MASYFDREVRQPRNIEEKQHIGRNDQSQDLSTILDDTQRMELKVLIARVIASMRTAVAETFRVPQSYPINDIDGQALEGVCNTTLDAGIDVMASQEPLAASGTEQRAKRRAIRYFDNWSNSVRRRIIEVLGKNDDDARARHHSTTSRSQEKETPADYKPSYLLAETRLAQLSRSDRRLVLHSLLLLLLSLKHYHSHSRLLLLNIASILELSPEDVNDDEAKVARGLLDAAIKMSADDEARQKRVEQNSNARRWKVGLASVAGAALIGITGGLAAPLVAAGIGTVMGGLGLGATAAAGYLGALAGSSVIVGGLFGAYGAKMTGRMMDKYAKEVEDFAFIPVDKPHQDYKDEKEAAQQDHRLRVTIGITGWATKEDDMVVPWHVIRTDSEVFALRWELESLISLGNAMEALVTSAAWTVAGREILSRTIFAGIMNAVMLPLVLANVARVVDNPFSVAKARADKTGEVLADALIDRAQGERPVTLISYSLGSRVVYSCLQSLARRGAYGLIESAILIGSPAPSNSSEWRMMRSVVTDRLVNVYSENDSVLAFLYRASSAQFGVAGLQPVADVPGVENANVSDIINGHLRYRYLIGKILAMIGFEELDVEAIDREEAALELRDLEEEQERLENQRLAETDPSRSQEQATSPPSVIIERGDQVDDETQRLERQVQRRTQEQLMHRKIKHDEMGAGERIIMKE